MDDHGGPMVNNDVVWGIVEHNWSAATTRSDTALGYLRRLNETWLRILNQRQTAVWCSKPGLCCSRTLRLRAVVYRSDWRQHVHRTKYSGLRCDQSSCDCDRPRTIDPDEQYQLCARSTVRGNSHLVGRWRKRWSSRLRAIISRPEAPDFGSM